MTDDEFKLLCQLDGMNPSRSEADRLWTGRCNICNRVPDVLWPSTDLDADIIDDTEILGFLCTRCMHTMKFMGDPEIAGMRKLYNRWRYKFDKYIRERQATCERTWVDWNWSPGLIIGEPDPDFE